MQLVLNGCVDVPGVGVFWVVVVGQGDDVAEVKVEASFAGSDVPDPCEQVVEVVRAAGVFELFVVKLPDGRMCVP